MKKIIFSLMIVSMILLLSNCNNSNEPTAITMQNYFPAKIGNYWVYDVQEKDSVGGNFKSYTDSMIINSISIEDGNSYYNILYYRNNFLYDSLKIELTNSQFKAVTKAFYPFLPLDTLSCWSRTKIWEMVFADFENNYYEKYDTVPGDRLPTRIVDKNGKETIIQSETELEWYYQYKRNVPQNIKIYDKIYYCFNDNISGNRILRILEPKNAQLIPHYNYKYLDSNRAVIENEYSLDMYFAQNIGIVQTIGFINTGLNEKFNVTRRLVRYKLN